MVRKTMYLEIQQAVRRRFTETVQRLFNVTIPEPALGFPPSSEMGEISIATCFDLAKQLRQPPRKIAEQVAAELLPIAGVERASIAGAGYINLHFDRTALASSVFQARAGEAQPPSFRAGDKAGKILVEHTSINPNKAAHIGHLRNAVLGDTLARLLRFQGSAVEVQNYIDNTGVQVADVVAGFAHLERKSLPEVRELIENPSGPRFDYYCWDLYARVFQHYEAEPSALAWRSETLRAVEHGHGDLAEMAETISTAITRLHLETMRRINIRYELLVQESEILRLNFWHYAFELMKKIGAIRFEDSGKNRGCWVMDLEEGTSSGGENAEAEDVKIIVRSNGTVTYVGKDIAYHLWKFALLGRDFQYQRFYRYPDGPNGKEAWRTEPPGEDGAPPFGHGTKAYAVIDTRQSYLQDIVRKAFLALGYREQAANLYHFAYEVVGLSPRCAEEMGLPLSDEDRRRSYVEVSGRRGLGIKADDLLDALEERALEEVQAREMTTTDGEQKSIARRIAVSALRYFLLKYTRRTLIAFDFKDALAFEGETGPYLQYTVVRARNIFRKFQETHAGFDPRNLLDSMPHGQLAGFLNRQDQPDFWDLTALAAQLELAVEQAVSSEEPAALAKYAFRLAQAFNNFYHHHSVLHETDPDLQRFLLALVYLSSETLSQALELLGIEIPARM
ncbi:MAG TPA: arginine--tRNA ligase [Terriglobia bacterium]|nr:arginine--tRNA ligase [Terriglobia bacterium]